MKAPWISLLIQWALQNAQGATARSVPQFLGPPQSQIVVAEPGNEVSLSASKLRREQSDTLCEAKTRHYTGSIPLDHGKDIFYWFFESMNSPKDDPILVWLSGGPGGASTFAALTEVGPCFINSADNTTYYNPYNWAQGSNLLIVDQPAGVGFSKPSSDPAFHVKTLETATHDFNLFLHHFFTSAFPEFSNNELHLAAESYGGRWGPAFLHHIIGYQNAQAQTAIKNPIKSLILVNAVIGALGGRLTTADYEFGCTEQGKAVELGLRFNSTACEQIQEWGPRCEKYAATCERENNIDICKDASSFCHDKLGVWVDLKGQNPYNIKEPCSNSSVICIDSIQQAEAFFDAANTKQLLGTEEISYHVISEDILGDFADSGAMTQSVLRDVEDLLRHTSVRLLFMNGDLDSLVITSGQKRIVDEIGWPGQLDYREQQWRDWYYINSAGKEIYGGQTKNSTKLRFVSFADAGHMVPQDQSEGAQQVLKHWLKE